MRNVIKKVLRELFSLNTYRKGNGMVVMAVTAAAISSAVALGIAKTQNAQFKAMDKAKDERFSSQYALDRADIIRSTKYSSLEDARLSRQQIGTTAYYEEVTVEPSGGGNERLVRINVYKGATSTKPLNSLTIKRTNPGSIQANLVDGPGMAIDAAMTQKAATDTFVMRDNVYNKTETEFFVRQEIATALFEALKTYLPKTEAEQVYRLCADSYTKGDTDSLLKAMETVLNGKVDGVDHKVDAVAAYFDVNGYANRAVADQNGNNIVATYATKSSLSGTNSRVTTLEGYFTSGKAKTAGAADTATKATKDGSGNVIVDTYQTKAGMSSYLTTSGKAASAGTADSATKATQDGAGNNIVNTYRKIADSYTKAEVDAKDNARLALSGGTMSGNLTFGSGNAGIIQYQRDDSNYTVPIEWYKGGKSQDKYDPQIGQHNTGGDGTGSLTILPYAISRDPWGGNVGLFVYKGGVKIDGNVLLTETAGNSKYLGISSKAASAGSADSATKATNDSSNRNIVNTYRTIADSYTKSEVDSKVNARLALSGGTMTGNIAFPAPTTAGEKHGLTFAGNNDRAEIMYLEPELSDDGTLRIQMSDNDNDRIQFAWNLWNADDLGYTNPVIGHTFTMNNYTAKGNINAGGTIYEGGTALSSIYLKINDAVNTYLTKSSFTSTGVTHGANTQVGSATRPVYIASNGVATAGTYSFNRSEISGTPNDSTQIAVWNGNTLQYMPNSKIGGGGGCPTGTILAFAGTTIPSGWLECNGQSCANYTALKNLLGSSNVPNLNGRFLEGTTGTPRSFKDAGLPDIVGQVTLSTNGNGKLVPSGVSGAFTDTTSSSSSHWNACEGGNDGNTATTLKFTASKNNTIYGKSTTVQPASYTVKYIIKT